MLKRILNNELLKTISANGVVVIFKVVASFIVSKVTAIYLGPAGYALVGNFKNVLQGLLGLTSTGFESGVIRYIAENKSDNKKLNSIVANVFVLNFAISCLAALPLFFWSEWLANYTLKEASYAYVFEYLACLLPLISFSFLSVYVVNGLQKFKIYTVLLSVSNILNAVLTFLLIYLYHLEGALFASLIVPALSFLVTFCFREVRMLFFKAFVDFRHLSVAFFKNISTYLLMAIYSAVLISLTYLFIRNAIIENLDTKMAGYWEAMNKISMFYMIFFSSLFTLYLLPKLSENKTVQAYKTIMSDYFKLLLPLTVVSFVGLYFLRFLIIRFFLTDEFLQIGQYFYLQLIGDFFKIVAFSLACQFHAKKMVVAYLVTDALLYGAFYFFSMSLLGTYQLYGVYYAYLVSVLLYLLLVCTFVFFNRKKYLKQ